MDEQFCSVDASGKICGLLRLQSIINTIERWTFSTSGLSKVAISCSMPSSVTRKSSFFSPLINFVPVRSVTNTSNSANNASRLTTSACSFIAFPCLYSSSTASRFFISHLRRLRLDPNFSRGTGSLGGCCRFAIGKKAPEPGSSRKSIRHSLPLVSFIRIP